MARGLQLPLRWTAGGRRRYQLRGAEDKSNCQRRRYLSTYELIARSSNNKPSEEPQLIGEQEAGMTEGGRVQRESAAPTPPTHPPTHPPTQPPPHPQEAPASSHTCCRLGPRPSAGLQGGLVGLAQDLVADLGVGDGAVLLAQVEAQLALVAEVQGLQVAEARATGVAGVGLLPRVDQNVGSQMGDLTPDQRGGNVCVYESSPEQTVLAPWRLPE
ncbi:hypothetical protein EYF80_021919 [Liparis tanakae]|uniref:Uncharacterized protein n=1 Tax=Liparis tanakae TaxID=230148 RepID=A0A4Z2HQN3_9TELE|nr:hypothetical protein EYF80_021919 [Liparis tanakae]